MIQEEVENLLESEGSTRLLTNPNVPAEKQGEEIIAREGEK